MTNTTDCPSDGKRGAKVKLPLLVHRVWSLYCSGFVWRFFSLSMLPPRLLQCRARPVECKQRDLGNDMPSYCATQKPSTSPSPLLGIFSPFSVFLFYLLREIARRSAVAAPSPFFYSTHTCMYLLTCYRFVAEICLGGVGGKTQRFKSIKSYVSL